MVPFIPASQPDTTHWGVQMSRFRGALKPDEPRSGAARTHPGAQRSKSPLWRWAGAALFLAPLTAAGPTPAGADATFFYSVSAQAAPWYAAISRDGYLLDPVMTGNILETGVDLSSTGTRAAVVSLYDVGGAGEAPALLPLVFPSLPAVPYPGYPLTVRSNYPAKPEARVGFGSAPVTDPDDLAKAPFAAGGGYGQARSSEGAAEGRAYGGELAAANGVLSVGQMRSRSEGHDDGDVVKGTATAVLNQVDIGGIVTIDTVLSKTQFESSDSGSMSRTVVEVQGVKALGAEAVIDEHGVRIVGLPGVPPLPGSSLAGLNQQLATALAQSKLTIRLLPSAEQKAPADSATTASTSGGALLVSYPFLPPPGVEVPQNPIPGFPVGAPIGGGIPTVVTLTLARTGASAMSGPGFGSFLGDSGPGSGDLGAGGVASANGSAPENTAGGVPSDGFTQGSSGAPADSGTAISFGNPGDLGPPSGESLGPPSGEGLPSVPAGPPADGGGTLAPPAPSLSRAGVTETVPAVAITGRVRQAFWWVLVVAVVAGALGALQIRRLLRSSGLSLRWWLS